MFELDLKSKKSIYEQVIDNLKERIMTGMLKAGDKLPSVRELSKTIVVNPNTVQKAYRELENEGYIYTLPGVGAFVQDRSEITVDIKKLEQAKKELEDDFKKFLYMGLSIEEAKAILLEIVEKNEDELGGRKDD